MTVETQQISYSNYDNTYDFTQAAIAGIETNSTRPNSLLIVDSNHDQNFLDSIKKVCLHNRYPIEILTLEVNPDTFNGSYLEKHIKRRQSIEHLPTPYIEFKGEQVKHTELEGILKRESHNYYLSSEEPIEVFSQNNLEQLQSTDLEPLRVNTVEELIEALPQYSNMFPHELSNIEYHEVDLEEHPITLENIPENQTWEIQRVIVSINMLITKFGKDEEGIYFFDSNGWYISRFVPVGFTGYTATSKTNPNSIANKIKAQRRNKEFAFYFAQEDENDTEIRSLDNLVTIVKKASRL